MKMLRWLLTFSAAALAFSSGAAIAQSPVSCATDPRFAQMDFTVGRWDVLADGKKTAEVTIRKILDDCALHESWAGADARSNGEGIFVFSDIVKGWHYLWASEAPSSTMFTGAETRPGEMRYVTKRPIADGKMRVRHWTLSSLPDGRVRELSLGSDDEGVTWTTEYDLYWVKKS